MYAVVWKKYPGTMLSGNPPGEIFTVDRFTFAGDQTTLDDLSRRVFAKADAKVYFALNQCAASSPPLRTEPYDGGVLEAQLVDQGQRYLSDPRAVVRNFVIVDGGMADNPRPALYRAVHHLDVLTTAASGALIDATLSGRACENDELGAVRVPADLRAGDLVALRTTGAYTYSMSSNYNWFPRPPVIAVGAGEPQVWSQREAVETISL